MRLQSTAQVQSGCGAQTLFPVIQLKVPAAAESGRSAPHRDYDVDFSSRQTNTLPPPPDKPAATNERASPTYEPYYQRPNDAPYDPHASAHSAYAHAHSAEDEANDQNEWAWGTGREERQELADAEYEAWRARKAREQQLDERVAALERQETAEREQRAARREVRLRHVVQALQVVLRALQSVQCRMLLAPSQ